MREARIIMPDGISAHYYTKLIQKAFGGATVFRGAGYWDGNSERILIVDIAYKPSALTDRQLFDLAWNYRAAAGQESVYLRYGNGHVQFVTEKSCMDNGENDNFDWDKLRVDLHRSADDENDIVEHAEHVQI